jgi:hypothetical protein
MFTTYLVIRVLHILLGAFWLGTAVFGAWYLLPAVADAGPDGAKVVEALQRRGWVAVTPVVAMLSIITGIWLYWRYTAGFSPDLSRSHAGMSFGIGGTCGVLAAVIGGAVLSRSLVKAGKLAAEAAGTTDATRRGALMAQALGLRRRALMAARLVSVLLVTAIVLMSIAVFI